MNVSIPEITDEELLKRYERIKPVKTIDGRLYYYPKFSLEELKNCPYLSQNVSEEVPENTLKICFRHNFTCFHKWDHGLFFRPKVAEVLSQIPKESLPFAKAFEIVAVPQSVYDFCEEEVVSWAFEHGYHISFVRLYK